MKNPFSTSSFGEEELKRNPVPLSYRSLFTSDFGKLIPAFVQEVLPGDTVRINKGSMIGIRGMPTVFPIQTNIRAGIEFYYVRCRNLMDNWEDYIFKTKDIEQAWLKLNNVRAKKMISTSSLGDFFGVASTKSDRGVTSVENIVSSSMFYYDTKISSAPLLNSSALVDRYLNTSFNSKSVSGSSRESFCYGFLTKNLSFALNKSNSTFHCSSGYSGQSSSPSAASCIFILGNIDGQSMFLSGYPFTMTNKPSDTICDFNLPDDFYDDFNSFIAKLGKVQLFFAFCPADSSLAALNTTYSFYPLVPSSSTVDPLSLYISNVDYERTLDSTEDSVISSNIYVGANPKKRLNVLPYRAYTQICNYYYRNSKNNPYVLNGEPQYNKFLPTTADGPDENIYDFYYRDWELDMYTSAVQSPQFGEAPLVGITYNPLAESAEFIFDVTDGDGQTTQMRATLGVDDDGKFSDIADFSQELPSANLRRLQRLVNYGISINDLRVTNSFQRFKENTLRRGLRYRNQLKSHMGVSVDYPDIDVPQYIGGFNGDIVAGQVTNTADSPNAGLGDYIGTLNGGIQASRNIQHYCPEHGFIIGIFSFAPSPSYPQSTKKMMLKTDAFDYFQKEFSKVGFVPIHYSEVCPFETPVDGDPDDVFGYQKAYYDYMQNVDEVHCDFRTTLRDFALYRTWGSRPSLSDSFVKVYPDQLNDVFVTQNIADAYDSNAKFMCSAHFITSGARPVNMFGQPSLE